VRGRPGVVQPTGALSRTIRRLLVRAWSRSNAPSRSVTAGSVDQRLPTCRTSPAASSCCSLTSALSWFSPAAFAIRPVAYSPRGSSPRAFFSRSSCCSDWRSTSGAVGCATGGCATSRAMRAGGVSPYRARHAGHKTTGSRPSSRRTSKLRHLRPDRQTPQRRPVRSTSTRSSLFKGIRSDDRESDLTSAPSCVDQGIRRDNRHAATDGRQGLCLRKRQVNSAARIVFRHDSCALLVELHDQTFRPDCGGVSRRRR
jgi:hypothetical protein